ncbi:biotin/lipoyl-containing protein, partial [Streptomyces sp. NPDC091259]|uniref:biotin/lipoyl-containing protein n=1 Tax=Streptomyces sp. NPDC091259 TaxID=3365976 RepID=UPI003802A22A
VVDPAFAPTDGTPFKVHTRWIETEFVNDIPAYANTGEDAADEAARERVVVEVGGQRLEVTLPAAFGVPQATGRPVALVGGTSRRRSSGRSGPAASGDVLASPMQGTVVKVAVEEGQFVEKGDLVVVLEAMKMEQPLNAHRSGTVKDLAAVVGVALTSGATICEIKD